MPAGPQSLSLAWPLLLCLFWLTSSVSHASDQFRIHEIELERSMCIRQFLQAHAGAALNLRVNSDPFIFDDSDLYLDIQISGSDHYRLFRYSKHTMNPHNIFDFYYQLFEATHAQVIKSYRARNMIADEKALKSLVFRFAELANQADNFDMVSMTGEAQANWLDQVIGTEGAVINRGIDQSARMIANVKRVFPAADQIQNYRDIYGSALLAYGIRSLKYGENEVLLPKTDHALIGRIYLERSVPQEVKSFFYSQLVAILQQRQVKEVFVEVADPIHRRLYESGFGFKIWKEIKGNDYGGDNILIMRAPLNVIQDKIQEKGH